ncbi:MAG: PQQ-binding-like beta-propeller repeat protein [Bacteroidia bacterium]|nr:PQQ-binding-like beta-propeller repeat protein [Bacteroidia bacterium]
MNIQTNAVGDVTLKSGENVNEYVKWSIPKGGSYIHTLLLYGNHLYNVNWNGIVVCLDAISGKEIYNAKLGKTKSFVASPVASDGKVYIVDEYGTLYIIQDGDTFKQLAEIPMNDICLTAPSITDGMMFFRTQKFLIAVGKK